MTPLRDSIITDSSLQAADTIRGWLEARLRAAAVCREDISLLMLAASEIATNISRHAYGGSPAGTITACLDVQPDQVRVSLIHQGEPFERKTWRAPDLGAPREGGYGIYLAESLMDQVLYETGRPDGHRVVLVKRPAQQSGAPRRYNAADEPGA